MFRYKLMQFMYGRYGTDELNLFLLILMVILAVINLFFHLPVIYILQTLCLVLYFVRFFSKNTAKRAKENQKFLSIKAKFSRKKDFNTVNYNDYNSPKKAKKEPGYKYFKCPNCSAKLRVPKGKGKITITCPRCRTSFKGKS